MNKVKVLYEDNHLIVVLKPENVLSQSDITGDIDMLTLTKQYLKEKYQKPGNVYLGLVHRLDRPVAGVMVFAKTSKAASRLSEQIRNHELDKRYLAVIKGNLSEKKGEFRDYLEKLETGNTIICHENKGKLSILEYEVIEEIDGYSLVDIHLITGRHHQIRVQFASRGFPLVGDQRYGKLDYQQLALWSYQLSFSHPTTHELLTFNQFPLLKKPWDQFQFCQTKASA